ncbi:helix-turn-helix domain-containing protein [Dysgonomonas sp. Marseille-P4677]|uniref:winged helix-turn-helix transcriptional regulator n=1 Tax=Dysgonomonas sp. Marseille-P4677 TaxID=2364790 RepID=UPI001F47B29E|nr:helix-turn-helix domain-containing protein [Dysgonomonas sp. Marseille-P4677]
MNHFGNKWSMIVIITLASNRTMRFNELDKAIVGISQKMLTSTLQALENDGFVSRTMYQEIPPRVEYKLSDLGLNLLPLIENVAEWITQYSGEINKAKQGRER